MIPVLRHPAANQFINELDPDMRERASEIIEALGTFGKKLPPPDAKKLDDKIYELRIVSRQHIRLLYGFGGEAAIIVHGFVKKTQKTPLKDLRLARKRLAAFAGL